MHGAELIHMIGLVGTGTSVIKTKQRRDQQSGFVMRYTVRPAKCRAALAVKGLAVGKEQTVLGGVLLAHLTSLPHEAMRQNRPAGDAGAFGNDEVSCNHRTADQCRCILLTEDRSIEQT